jgi:hypothetical protein
VLITKVAVRFINMLIEVFASKRFNLIHVVEYPKCGGTWVSRLIATYLQRNRALGSTMIVRSKSVLQKHVMYRSYYDRVIVVLRDPRDVFVSFYYHEIYHKKDAVLMKNMGYNSRLTDHENFKNYLVYKINHPSETSPGFSYSDFYNSWSRRNNVHIVHYEQLHNSPAKILAGIIRFLNSDVDPRRIKQAIGRHSFKNITGREEGEEDRYSHKRKGIIGDWKNYFTEDMCKFLEEKEYELFKQTTYSD